LTRTYLAYTLFLSEILRILAFAPAFCWRFCFLGRFST